MNNSRNVIRDFITDAMQDLSSFEPNLTFSYNYNESQIPQFVIQLSDERNTNREDEGGSPHLNKFSCTYDLFYVGRISKDSSSIEQMEAEINEWIERIRYRILRANLFTAPPTDSWYDNSTQALTFYIDGMTINAIQPVSAYEGEIVMIRFNGAVSYRIVILENS